MHFHGTDPESIRRRLGEIAEEERQSRRVFTRAVLAMIASVTAGLLVMAWGFGMRDPDLGYVVFLGGAGIGNLGVLFALLWAYRERED